ncbi:MAG TPA: hypothetical protein VFE69_12865 [Ilumatobacteraceae bacterium]|nr:hypothetical protein [Ilumatobacteraceae bacterium]
MHRDGNSETTGTIPTIYDRWSPLPRSETWDIWRERRYLSNR